MIPQSFLPCQSLPLWQDFPFCEMIEAIVKDGLHPYSFPRLLNA
jgi:hypothetical protein